MRTLTLQSVAATTAVVVLGAFVVKAATLDGTKWKVKVTPDKAAADKGEKEFDDELIFADGKFTSSACLSHGFKPSKYKYESEDNEAEFEVEQVSDKEGVATWLGQVMGTNTVGRLAWKKKDGTNLAYDFNGSKE